MPDRGQGGNRAARYVRRPVAPEAALTDPWAEADLN